jgi:hypothetical protein
MCADMLLEVESAGSAAYYTRPGGCDDAADLPLVASLAKAHCSEAYRVATSTSGSRGIGFTWEHDAHRTPAAKSAGVMLACQHRTVVVVACCSRTPG